MFRKGITLVVMLLFVGVSFLPSMSGNEVNNITTNNILNDYIRYDDFEDYYVGEPPKSSRGWSTSGEDQYQFVEARVDPLDSSNMVMLIHGSSATPGEYCYIHQRDFANPFRYAIHYRIYTPQLSMTKTVYERLFEGNTDLVTIHRRPGEIRWGHYTLYQFVPHISPSTTRWIEEEVRITPDELRIWHDNSIDALGGYYNHPANGIDRWGIGCYRESTQDIYIDDFWITVYNRPPDAPIIDGPINGKAGVEYGYNFSLSDSDNDSMHLRVDWGCGTPGKWYGPYASGTKVKLNHSWNEKGTYIVRAQAIDAYDAESDWGTLEVTMPKNQQTSNNMWLLRWLERFPILQKILDVLMLNIR